MELDHLAVTAADLEQGADWVARALGVVPGPGGAHAHYATHNRLLGLGPGLYLEVIAPDPAAPRPAHPRWFGLDRAGAPRLGNWIVRVPDLAAAVAAAPEAGVAVPLSRGDLNWTIAVPPDGSLPLDGGYPTLIQWGPGTHPAGRLPDLGLRLLALDILHPRADALRARLHALNDPRVSFVPAAAPALRARIATPDGEKLL